MAKINQSKIDELDKYLEKIEANEKYSLQRFDLLVIAIASSGILLSVNTIKFLLEKKPTIEFDLLQFAILSFGLSAILNFLSQWSGYFANNLEKKWIGIEKGWNDGTIWGKAAKQKEEVKQTSIDRWVKTHNMSVAILNLLSTVILIIAIVLVLIFFYQLEKPTS